MSPGLTDAPAGQVLGGADDRHEPAPAAPGARSPRPPRSPRRRRTCRTSSPPFSPRASARCRRCRTSPPCRRSRASGRCGAGRPLVAQRDQRRLLLGALGDRGERAHAARDDPLASLHLHRQRRRSPRPSASRVLGQRASGVRSLPGRFCRSRAALTASATSAASATRRARGRAGAETIRRSRCLARAPRLRPVAPGADL